MSNEIETPPCRETVLLDGQGADIALVGSKAAMLDRLITLDATVPRSGAVTTAAYRRFVSGSRELEALLDELRAEPVPALSERERACHRVDDAFLSAPMPDDLAAAVIELADDVGAGGPVAVRSSATAEDLPGASFAGQYRTLLSVEPDQVLTAVRLAFASLWHPTPRAYRRFRAIDEADLAMAALVMVMLDPSHAGVLFTEAPGRPEAIRIEVVRGLGESLVSGARTPEVVVVDRDDLDHFHPEPEPLRDLAEISLRMEREIGLALDIEWAIEHGTVQLLQARPITTSALPDDLDDGFDVGMGDQVRYTTAGIAEMLPGVQTPRVWSVNSWLVEEAFRGLFDGLGADLTGLDQPHALVGRFRGRAVLNLDLMERIVESVPGGSSAELEHQYFGDILDPVAAPDRTPTGGSRLLQGARTLRSRGRAFRVSELVIQAIDGVLDAEPDVADLSDGSLLAFRGRLLHLACRTMEAEVSVAATAAACYRSLEVFLREHIDPREATTVLQHLTTSDRATYRGRNALAVDELTARLKAAGDLGDKPTESSWPHGRKVLEESAAGREFLLQLDGALRRAGSISVFGGITWDSVPELVWPLLGQQSAEAADLAGQRADTLARLEQEIGTDARWRLTRALSGQLVDVRRHFLRREAADAAAFLERREETKASLLMLGGVLWRIDHELGCRMTAASHLDAADDIDLITGEETELIVRGRVLSPEVLAFRRRRHAAAELESPLPQVFRGRPAAPTSRPVGGDHMTGWSGSPGRYEGRARVVTEPETSALRRGEVLVARTTDSSWLPLFHIAGAIVIEEGGPLSHAAILARELGMPSVINVPGIVDRVASQPGALLTVDGTRGQVGIHQPEPAEQQAEQQIDVTNGVAPIRREPSAIDRDPGQLNVFITGLIGAGAFMSIVIGMTQAIGSSRTQHHISLRARPRAEALAAGVVHGFEPRAVGAAGLRARGYYMWLAAVGAALTVLMLWQADDYVEDPESTSAIWQFALGLVSAATLAGLTAISIAAAIRWPFVPPMARWATLPRVHERLTPARVLGPTHAGIVGALLFATLCLGWLVAEAETQLLALDEWLFDAIGAGTEDRWSPDVLNEVLRREVMVPLAVVLTAATYRCRALLFTYPLVIAAGGALHLGIAHFISRERPPAGPKPGFTDSFPGGHVNELTIMLGLLPLVVFVLTRRTWVGIASGVVSGTALVVLVADAFRTGDHWPTDNLAGLLIGLSMVTIAHGVSRSPALHGRCEDCPAQLHPPT
ncbi:MAG: PEP-utilizing enzyme [Acidimicrobiia bacterium]|nr:PEP-utilizing enzyme [Acidimicrobiia bacterium]